MNEKNRKIIIFLLLIASIIWASFNFHSSTPKTAIANNQDATRIIAPSKQQVSSGGLINIEKKEKEKWGHNPFKKPTTNYSPAPQNYQNFNWQLSGIIYNQQSPIAIINNKPKRTGETINEAKIIKIYKNKVILQHNGKQMTLTVNKG